MTDPALDRMNRDGWVEAGSRSLLDRACEQVDLRLANYQPFDTDPAIDAEMRRLVMDGLESQDSLPALPPLSAPPASAGGRRRRGRRRRRAKS